MQYVMDNKI